MINLWQTAGAHYCETKPGKHGFGDITIQWTHNATQWNKGRVHKKNRKKTDKCQFSMYVCRPEK